MLFFIQYNNILIIGETPILHNIIPRSVYPTGISTWRGAFRTQDKEDIVTIRIGDTICDRFKEEKEEQSFELYSIGMINCTVSSDIPAGYYPAKLKTLDGWTKSLLKVPSVRIDNG